MFYLHNFLRVVFGNELQNKCSYPPPPKKKVYVEILAPSVIMVEGGAGPHSGINVLREEIPEGSLATSAIW